MASRDYRQACPLAAALDLLGQRWTLLIVRDLLIGPKRYGDLLKGLPGIGTNLLADRLKQLAKAGVVERIRLPPPAGSRVYRLTERGRALEPALVELCRWGLRHGPPLDQQPQHDPLWAVLSLRAAFLPERAREVRATCEFRIGDSVLHAAVDGGALATEVGPALRSDLVVTLDDGSFRELIGGRARLEELLWEGRAELTGDLEAYGRFAACFAA